MFCKLQCWSKHNNDKTESRFGLFYVCEAVGGGGESVIDLYIMEILAPALMGCGLGIFG